MMNYIGNCTEDEAWETIFSDASDMACVIEDSVNLRLEKFIKIANPNIDMTKLILDMTSPEFGYHKSRHIAWTYDSVKDIQMLTSKPNPWTADGLGLVLPQLIGQLWKLD